jgi:hypothetical protein
MRPTYETANDLQNEQEIISFFTQHFNKDLNAVKIPKQYKIDYCLMIDDKITAFAEVKKRTCEKNMYETYMLSLAKYLESIKIKKDLSLETILVVKWTDAVGYIELGRRTWPIGFGGRVDRGDWQDKEPMVFIPISEFGVV